MLMIVSAKYRLGRLVGFFDQQGSATGANWQTTQGKYALGSGGIFGVGLGEGRQKWGYVPESTSDFIFAIIGEELGLVGTLCVTALYGGLAWAGLRVARRAPDTFSRLTAAAITAWIVMQAVVNIGAVIGIPGASYLTALHHLVAGKYSTAIEVIAVFVFVIISFLLIIIPFAFLELRPEATKARLKHSQIWLGSHAKQLIAVVALLLGAYLAISAVVRLS